MTTEMAPVSVPLSWLEENAAEILADQGGDYEAAAGAPAANGQATVWQCYLAGLDPMDADAEFRLTAEVVDGDLVLTWEPNLGDEERTYEVQGKASMLDDWGPVDENSSFYRVLVTLPE